MRDPAEIREAVAEENPKAYFADGFDNALVGLGYRCGKPALAVYSVQKCIAGGIDNQVHLLAAHPEMWGKPQ